MTKGKKEDFLDVAQRCINNSSKEGRKIINPNGAIATAEDIAKRLSNTLNSEEARQKRKEFFSSIKTQIW
ncbi:MAG: hypothetical protein PHY93_20970 [Bacteriovorax sp.]|nr:hypothetical protein [Bacteriovorax sp.]